MATFGKLEALITINAKDYEFVITETGGGGASDTITLSTNNTYYHSTAGNDTVDLPARIAALCNAATLNATYTCTVAAGENGTGKYTITASGGGVTAIAIAWSDTEIRDLLGFTGNVSGALSHTSPNHAKSLWLPDGTKITPYGDEDDGTIEADARAVTSRSGDQYTIAGFTRRFLSIEWHGVRHARARVAAESTTGESFEQFWVDAIQGQAAHAVPGGPVRLHWDAADDATYTEYRIQGAQLARLEMEPLASNGWRGQWIIPIDRMMKVPS